MPRHRGCLQAPLPILSCVSLLGHTDWVTHIRIGPSCVAEPSAVARRVQFHSDQSHSGIDNVSGRLLCTASRDHSIRVWLLADCERRASCLHVLRGHTRWLTGIELGLSTGIAHSPQVRVALHNASASAHGSLPSPCAAARRRRDPLPSFLVRGNRPRAPAHTIRMGHTQAHPHTRATGTSARTRTHSCARCARPCPITPASQLRLVCVCLSR